MSSQFVLTLFSPLLGILRESISNQVKHVSFADQATVIVIDDSPPKSPSKEELPHTPTKSASPTSSKPTSSSTAPLIVETGVLDSSENSRLLLSPLTQIQRYAFVFIYCNIKKKAFEFG